ncbi:hypothetical protein B9Z55_007695 [Caenorhabditis nigoni]|uniref:BTB domain-containing protein n=1 Tax=Caenorhabditis nigoni TaxID=1611254 RepID=A0A2G5VAY4_9PELO|nr:hypothetical protein B9Z55_007695 [Caenorhabditis nigoni]
MAANQEGNNHLIKIVREIVADEIEKANKPTFDELSDKLQSMEASISKLSENDSKKMSISEKAFQLKHVFKDVNEIGENISEWEDHFNASWRITVLRRNSRLHFFVHCDPIAPADEWSIRTRIECKFVGPNNHNVIKTGEVCYEKSMGLGLDFLEWKEMKQRYLMDGSLTVEATVTIIETTGLGKEKIRNFDESQKDVSDVILVVGDTKFYVLKMYLAAQSSVFKTLLLGNFSESKKSEVPLNGIDPDDFHSFLEVLYGESAIDDSNVEGVALLADMYDAPTAIRKCEEFLLKESKKTLEKKLEIANRYHLEKLEEKCMSEIATTVVPKDNKTTMTENVQVPKEDGHQTKLNFFQQLICVFFCFSMLQIVQDVFERMIEWRQGYFKK